MKKKVVFLLLIYPFITHAQFSELLPGFQTFKRSEITVNAGYSLDSKNINNHFINEYRSSRFLSSSLKDEVLKKLDDKNTIGGDMMIELLFRSKADSISGNGWFVGLSHASILDARFTKDLFHLYFYGNKPFAGQTADLSDLKYSQIQFQEVKGGMFHTKENERHRSILALGLGYVNGQDFVRIKTGNSSLFTAVDGTNIQMDLQLNAEHADSSRHLFGSMNGSGLALYLFYQWEKKNNYRLSFELKDAGFISWNKKTTHLAIDTNYFFDGVQVNNLLDSLYLEVKSVDDYKNSFLKENNIDRSASLIPAQLSLSFEKWLLHNHLMLGLHASYRFATLQVPVIELKGTWTNKRNIFAGVGLQYGGYNNFHAGVHFGFLPVKNWLIAIGSNYVDGLVLYKKRGGQGGYIRVGVRL